MQVYDELADLRWERFCGFSFPALFPGRKQARHPIAFKFIGFAGKRALGDIDFFRSLPCGFVEQDEGPDLLVQLLLRPQRPLLYLCPLLGALSAIAFWSRHLPLPSDPTTLASSVPNSPKSCKESGNVCQFGLPIYVKHVTRQSPVNCLNFHRAAPAKTTPKTPS